LFLCYSKKHILFPYFKFPFEYKSLTNQTISETNESHTPSPQNNLNISGDNDIPIVDSRSLNSTPTIGHESCNSNEYISHSSEQIPQTQWEMAVSTGGPVVCAPQYTIYHQTTGHYYPTNAPMAGHYFGPVPNGAMTMGSNKDVNKMRPSGSVVVNSNGKSAKSIQSPEMRPPFYPQPNQYSEVN